MTNSKPKHTYRVQILERHLDSFGHVNNAEYLTLMEEARWDLITSGGYGLSEIMAKKIGPTILSIQIEYRKEIKNREWIIIETELVEEDARFATLKHEIKGEAGDLRASALYKIAIFDMVQRKLVKASDDWISATRALRQN